MKQAVEFWYVEAFSCTKVNEDLLVVMKKHKGLLEAAERLACVCWELCEV